MTSCSACGEAVPEQAKFCRACGTELGDATAATETAVALPSLGSAPATAEQGIAKGGAPPPPPIAFGARRGYMTGLAIGGALVVLVVALLASGALGGGDDNAAQQSSNDGQSTTHTPRGTSADQRLEAEKRSLLSDLDGILNESAQGRAQITETVQNLCGSVSPSDALVTIQRVITNRQNVQSHLQAIDTSSDPENARLVDLLLVAINVSLDSNYAYQDWFHDLDANGCGASSADAAFARARDLSDQATAAKKVFVAAYNPVAARLGLKQWADTEF